MTRTTKSRALYTTPFCKAYWRDAAAELKDLRMLVFAALIVALRVALKTVVRIPLAPSLDITPAFLANALSTAPWWAPSALWYRISWALCSGATPTSCPMC